MFELAENSYHSPRDWRNIANGRKISLPEGYVDQPYLVKADDGAWVLVVTHNPGHEGDPFQSITCIRSYDQGKYWSDPIALEQTPPGGGYEASYAVLLKSPSGRLFAFYNYNKDNMRSALAGEYSPDDPCFKDGKSIRVDSLGAYVFRYSDDHGKTWSSERIEIPMREFEIDRENPYGGEVRYFWNVGKAFEHGGAAYVPLHKVGSLGFGFFTRSEGALLTSSNLLGVDDPRQATWETLPDGDVGLRAPDANDPIAEEQSFSVMGDGSFFVVYRTTSGHPACSYSRDNGHSWSKPEWMTYHDGRPMRHPRAANFAWRLQSGRWLYWFHNHGGRDYPDRNPVWVCSGEEIESDDGLRIQWSEPEILLYSDKLFHRMSYPDLIEDGGQVFITETQKTEAKLHLIPNEFLSCLFGADEIISGGDWNVPLVSWENNAGLAGIKDFSQWPMFAEPPKGFDAVRLPWKRIGEGVTVELIVIPQSIVSGETVLDARQNDGTGMLLRIADRNRIELQISDGRRVVTWYSDDEVLSVDKKNHLGIVIDGAACIITMMINGRLCDGARNRQVGFGRIDQEFRGLRGPKQLDIARSFSGIVTGLHIYGRAVMHAELVARHSSLIHSEKRGGALTG